MTSAFYSQKQEIMNAKEKANDLVKRFENENLMFENEILDDAKESALITVNEILVVLYEIFESYDLRSYWEGVRNEINNL